MSKIFTRIAVAAITIFASVLLHAQALQAIGTLKRGKDLLDFYKAAISNPEQVFLLAIEIQSTFGQGQTRYKDLSNNLAQKFGLFYKGPLALDHIELRPEASPGYEYGYFSITLKQLTFKECEVLANYPAIDGNFVRVELNGTAVYSNGSRQQKIAACRSEWFFQDGKNELKYVSY